MIFLISLLFYLQVVDSIYKHIKLSNEKEVDIEVKLNFFKFNLKPSSAVLADIKMNYDSNSFVGVVEYENNSAKCECAPGTKVIGNLVIKGDKKEEDEQLRWAGLKLSPTNSCSLLVTNLLPLYLDMELRLCNSVIDLSGLKLAQLNLSTSGNTTVQFNSPNPIMCKTMSILATMSKFKGEFLGNAGFDVLYFHNRVSSAILDFRGEFKGRRRVEIQMGAGSLKLILPKDAGIRLKSTGISVQSISGLTRDENAWYQSHNWGTTDKELIIHIDGSLGLLRVETI